MISIKSVSGKWQVFVDEHPKAKIVFKGFGYLFSERMVKFILGFFVHALVARHLGPTHFGKLSYIIKTVNIFYTFSLFGVDEIIIKMLVEGHYRREDILKTVFRLRIGMSCIGFLALGIFLLIFQPEGHTFALLTFLYGVNIFFQAFNLFELNFQAKLSFKPLFWANNISYIGASFMRVVGVWTHMGISFFMSTYLVGELILKSLIQKKLGFKAFSGLYLPDLAKSIARESFPYFISAFVVILDQRLSFLFIEKDRTLTELGNYSVAVTLVDLWLFLPTAVCAAVFPTIVTSFNSKKEAYQVRIQYLADIMVWLGIVFFIGVYFSSDLVINLLYGERYKDAPSSLGWYALTTIPVFFNLARIKWMALEKKLHDWLWISSFCLVINVCGHFWAVPRYGVQGAIGSFLLSQLIGNLIFSLFFPSVRRSMRLFLKTFSFPLRVFVRLR